MSMKKEHKIFKIIAGIEKLYDVTKPFSLKEKFFGKKVSILEKINYVKKLDSTKIRNEVKYFNTKYLEDLLLDDFEADQELKMSDLRKFETKFDFLFEYFQHILRCVYFRLDNSGKRLLMHYSPIATYSRTWNMMTRSARGLVIDLEKREIVVHPYDKFHNFREVPETQEANLPDLPYEDAEKLDGSEGIMYTDVDGSIRIITKGGFDTDQGRFATEVLYSKYGHIMQNMNNMRALLEEKTFIFEILYADDDMNRIVVKYGSEPDLRLIGVRDLYSGETYTYSGVQNIAEALGFPSIKIETMTLDQMLLEKSKRTNFEGWVRRYSNGLYMKIKCDEYLDHHGARFGTSLKAVFNLIREEKWDDFIGSVPEEFREISNGMHKKIIDYAAMKEKNIWIAYHSIPLIHDQRTFAQYVNANIAQEYQGFMYTIRAGKELNYLKSITSWVKFRDRMEEDLK